MFVWGWSSGTVLIEAKGTMDTKRIIIFTSAVALTGLIADVTLGGPAALSASGSKRRLNAVVETTTSIVSVPVVEAKNETTQLWQPATEDTVVTIVGKAAEEPFRPFIPLAMALTVLDCNGNGTPDSTEISQGAMDWDADGVLDSCEYRMGDLNLNGVIDGQDVSILLGWWGVPNPLFGDLDGDNAVNARDLGTLLARFGVVMY